MAPEYFRFGWYDGCQATVWALGMILVDMLSPYMAFSKPEQAYGRPPRIPNHLSPGNVVTLSTALFTNMRILKFRSQPTIAFSMLSIILTNLLGNKTLLHGFKRSWFVICDPFCVSISRFVACDRNYD